MLADASVLTRTILADGVIAGHALSFERDGRRLVGYWVGREHWGRGIASRALPALLALLPQRPLHATVASTTPPPYVSCKAGFEVCGHDADGLVLRLG